MSIYSIYKISNKNNGKVYIGFTKNDKTRIYNHRKRFPKKEYDYEIIYQSTDGHHCLHVMEPHFIAEYDSMKTGYNVSKGGISTKGRPRGSFKKPVFVPKKDDPNLLADMFCLLCEFVTRFPLASAKGND